MWTRKACTLTGRNHFFLTAQLIVMTVVPFWCKSSAQSSRMYEVTTQTICAWYIIVVASPFCNQDKLPSTSEIKFAKYHWWTLEAITMNMAWHTNAESCPDNWGVHSSTEAVCPEEPGSHEWWPHVWLHLKKWKTRHVARAKHVTTIEACNTTKKTWENHSGKCHFERGNLRAGTCSVKDIDLYVLQLATC